MPPGRPRRAPRVETAAKGQSERILNTMDVGEREEFEAARDMAAKAGEENTRLAARIEAVEAKLAELTEQTEPAAAAKPKPKK